MESRCVVIGKEYERPREVGIASLVLDVGAGKHRDPSGPIFYASLGRLETTKGGQARFGLLRISAATATSYPRPGIYGQAGR